MNCRLGAICVLSQSCLACVNVVSIDINVDFNGPYLGITLPF